MVGQMVGQHDLRGVRIGVPKTWFFDICEPEVAKSVWDAIRTIEELGATCREIDLPHVHLAEPIGRTIVTVEAGSLHEPTMNRLDEYDDGLADRLLLAQFVSALDYARSLRMRHLLQRDFASAFSHVDAIVTPTSPVAAPRLDDLSAEVGDETVAWSNVVTRATYPASVAGLPALSTPTGFTSSQLPIGMQIIAPPLRDELCLRIGQAYEAATCHGSVLPTELVEARS
jgi:aspartyl-tRNA(Asn)/glutamyl-tRNA(Gln) amidotransferase subunit A